jgi:hypothetical protein
MSQVRPDVLRDVEDALKRYTLEVEQSKMAPSTKRTYLLHARNFVRWLRDDFEPGKSMP